MFKVLWELVEALGAGSSLLLTAGAGQGGLLRHGTTDFRFKELVGKGF